MAQGKAPPGVSPPSPDRQPPVASGPAADRHIAAARPQRRAVQSSARPGAPPLRRGYIGLGLACCITAVVARASASDHPRNGGHGPVHVRFHPPHVPRAASLRPPAERRRRPEPPPASLLTSLCVRGWPARCGWARGPPRWGCSCCAPRQPAPGRPKSCTTHGENTAPTTTARRCWAAR